MVSESTFKSIPLDSIDIGNQRFRISTGDPEEPLVASIDLLGVLTPPILLPADQSFAIVSGFKRIRACAQLGMQKVTARVLSCHTPEEQCIHIAISDNALNRELNLIEQAHAIQMLDSVCTDPETVCLQARRLGLSINVDLAEKLRKVAQMDALLQKALILGHVALPVALRLHASSDTSTIRRLVDILADVGLSLNRQREWLDLLFGISRRDGIDVGTLLNEDDVKAILNDDTLDRRQKGRQVRQLFRKWRYPEITATQELYNRTVKALKLGEGTQLIGPQYFESQTYTLKLDFKDYEELIQRYKALAEPVHSSVMKSFWDMLKQV